MSFSKYRKGEITIIPLLNIFKAILFENTEAAKRAADRRRELVDTAVGAIEHELLNLVK